MPLKGVTYLRAHGALGNKYIYFPEVHPHCEIQESRKYQKTN